MRRFLQAARDAWLVLGIALAILLAAEGAYRLQRVLRGRITKTAARQDSASTIYPGATWLPEFLAARKRQTFTLDPYRGFWSRPVASRLLNVDSGGYRVTVRANPLPTRLVYMLGGSAMWGFTARDSFTIPSQLAAALAERGVTDVGVVNLAQRGFNSTQELATLLDELAHGATPAAVIAFNGGNDAGTVFATRKVGHTYSQDNAQKLVDLGRRGFGHELLGLGRHSALIQRVLGGAGTTGGPPSDRATLCRSAGAYYGNLERSLLAIAKDRGFPALIFLQPDRSASHKLLTVSERALPPASDISPCLNAMAAAMQPHAGRTFFDLRSLFDADTTTVFVDVNSHMTEAANGRVAAAMADKLAPLLKAPTSR
jgi:hypothetical protein